MSSFIFEYVRHPHDEDYLVGCVLATVNKDNELVFGWSQCNPIDQFSKRRAVEIALGRALCARPVNQQPRRYTCHNIDGSTYKVDMFGSVKHRVAERAAKYFKQLNIAELQTV